MDVIHSRKATWLRLSEFTHISEPFLWDLTKRRDDIAVADMVADMEVHMVADMVADMFADIVAKMGTQFGKKKKKGYPIWWEGHAKRRRRKGT